MSKRKYAKEPLLFIHQASVSTPKAPMQENYVGKRKKAETTKEEPKEKVPKKVYSTNNEEDHQKEEDGKERKQFKDMTIRERVEHFATMSPHAPKMKCEVKTDKKTYRGLIMDFKEEVVFVQSGKRMYQLTFVEIKDIKIIGF